MTLRCPKCRTRKNVRRLKGNKPGSCVKTLCSGCGSMLRYPNPQERSLADVDRDRRRGAA